MSVYNHLQTTTCRQDTHNTPEVEKGQPQHSIFFGIIEHLSKIFCSKKKKTFHSDLKEEIREIRQQNNWRMSGSALAKIWVAKYHDPEKVLSMVQSVIENDSRYCGKEESLSIDTSDVYRTLEELIQQKKDRTQTDKKTRNVMIRIWSFFSRFPCFKRATPSQQQYGGSTKDSVMAYLQAKRSKQAPISENTLAMYVRFPA